MWEIDRRLFLGTREDSENAAALEEAGISHVLNCAAELSCIFEEQFCYMHLKLADPDANLHSVLEPAFDFIDRGREQGGVLSHCSGAVSRSPAMVLAYLCQKGCLLSEATSLLQRAVPTRPNQVFLEQISNYFSWEMSDEDFESLLEQLGTNGTE